MRIVIKIGSSVITEEGRLVSSRLAQLVGEIAQLSSEHEIAIVTSGAVAAGSEFVPKDAKKDKRREQILASIGQPHLVVSYYDLFKKHHISVAQVLVTHDDFNQRSHYLNIRDTLVGLISQGVIPIINENDVVSFSKEGEEQFDNDNLAALTALAIDAERLYLIFDGEGFIKEGKVLRSIDEITSDIEGAVTKSKSESGRGGMMKKLDAIRRTLSIGTSVDLLPGKKPRSIDTAQKRPGSIGTHFEAKKDINFSNRQKWLLAGAFKHGAVTIDEKAVEALKKEKSLLAVGIIEVEGRFNRDTVINIQNPDGETIGAGITHYNSEEVSRIKKQPSDKIESVLGYIVAEEVIHRDHIAIS